MSYENSQVQISETLTKNQLETLRFTGLTERSALPMYCKMTVPVDVDKVTAQEVMSAGHEGHFLLAQKVVFPLSRPLAKLSVYAAKAQGTTATPQILSVDLLAAGTREFCYLFPQSDDVLKAVVSRANNRALLEKTVPVTAAVAKGTPSAEDPADYTPVVNGVYLPEVAEGTPYSQSFLWNVSSGDSREAVLNVRYTLDEGQDIRNGYIYCLGRKYGYIKYKGHRMETEEIRNVILSLDGVEQCEVSAVTNPSGTVTGITAKAVSFSLSESDIKAAVAEFLPDYMIPKSIKILDRISFNSNGKQSL